MSRKRELQPVVRRLINEAGATTQSLGLGRVIGKIFAYLYFSPAPRCLGDIQNDLGISKGSASMGVRHLEDWEAVQKVKIPGDRKDHYEACDWFGRIIKRAVAETFTEKMLAYQQVLGEVRGKLAVEPDNHSSEETFIRDRLDHLETFHKRVASFWNNPVVKALLR